MMDEVEKEIVSLEKEMLKSDFWQNKEIAQETLKKINELKEKKKSKNKYDKGDAIITIFSGAGGDDAEDWARMLFDMYSKYFAKTGWSINIIHEHTNDHNGIKNITFEVVGNPPAGGAFGNLKNESGVHRLVRISPFSAKKLRHTSFALVEVIPRIIDNAEVDLPEKDLKVEFSRSSGAGGQNVNKRETAVRVVHLPTGIAVHAESERSQLQNKNKALEILKSKIYRLKLSKGHQEREEMKISKVVDAEWGYQIRSYVLHPYKMAKDHRTGTETSDVEGVLNGDLDLFIESEKKL